MGRLGMNQKLVGVALKRSKNSEILVLFDLNEIIASGRDLERETSKLRKIYERHIEKIKSKLEEINQLKRRKEKILAVQMWELGDLIFKMLKDFENTGYFLESLYETLKDEFGISRSSLEKIISLRTSAESKTKIPPNLSWREVRSAPKKYFRELNAKNKRSDK
jgi:phosphoribosyl-ATP pyrophosphohydrolase